MTSIHERLRAAGLPPLRRPVWIEVDVPALTGNVTAIRSLVGPDVQVWPVVKADGYGHGMEVVSRACLAAGAQGVCVATLDEALAIRAAGIPGPVLILYPIPAGDARDAARMGFELSVSTLPDAEALAQAWVAGDPERGEAAGSHLAGSTLRIHVEVETGLTRMGVHPEVVPKVLARMAVPGIEVVGVWSHLATPEDPVMSASQEVRFDAALDAATLAGPRLLTSHLAATGGLLTGRGTTGRLVRPGLITYGVAPEGMPLPAGMRPVMRLKALPLRILEVPAGTAVGYGGKWVAARVSRIATLPVGYGDGYPRRMSGGPVLVRGQRVPVVGMVSMDALTVDVTDVPAVGPEDEFVLLGSQGGVSITALELAQWRTTIPWEVLTDMARRPTRVYDAGVGLLGVRTLAGETLAPPPPLS